MITNAPGPAPITLLRQIPAILRDPLSFLLASTQEYGDLVQYPVGNLPVYAAHSPAAIRHILQDNHRNFSKDTVQFNTLALLTGRGLLTSDGDVWLRQRRMLQPAFHRQRLAGFGAAMRAAAAARIDTWTSGHALDIDGEMMAVTLEIVGRTLFSADLRGAAAGLVRATLTALDFIVFRAQTPMSLPLWVPTPRHRRFLAARRQLNQAVHQLVAERRALAARGAPPPADLLQMLLEARTEDGRPMPEGQVRDELITLLIAGHETVASALTWTWHLLAQHPAAEARLHAELDAMLGGQTPGAEDVARLPYTRAVFDEALRLYPPAWLITRKALAPDTIDGRAIPAGALLILSPYVAHRRPAAWSEPETFRPERFLDGAPVERFAYLPFGAGPRLCIGQAFALMEGPLVLAAVAQKFRLRPVGGRPVRVDALVTLRPHGGLWMTPEAR